jgi:hypothetical protein
MAAFRTGATGELPAHEIDVVRVAGQEQPARAGVELLRIGLGVSCSGSMLME